MAWDQLLSIYKQAAEQRRLELSVPPQACPNDGTPLIEVGGVWACTFDGYQWPRDGRL